LLLRVLALVPVGPYIVEILIELIKLLYDLSGTDLDNLLLIFTIIAFLSFGFLLGLLLGTFLTLGFGIFLILEAFRLFLLG
jgi:hypothetical protein